MTIVTLVARCDVRGIFPRCRETIVTGAAGAGHLRVIDRIDRRPYVTVMAVLAHIARENMIRVLACCVGAVMATNTVAGDVDVIEVRRHPAACRMAVVAVVTAVEVSRVFARCRDAVVAGAAVAHDLRMIDGEYRHEHIGVVAVLADIAGLYVRGALAGRLHTVMAARAVA